jgi:hypothetical protein
MDGWCVTAEECLLAREKYGSPCFLYSADHIKQQAHAVLSLPAPYGLTVRYAMKVGGGGGDGGGGGGGDVCLGEPTSTLRCAVYDGTPW